MSEDATAQLVYGTCVALGPVGALLQGPSGSGKSDLALRFALETPADLDPALVADDQVRIERAGDRLIARPPATIAGKIEVRGIGIVTLPYRREAALRLVIRLCSHGEIPRLPLASAETTQFHGIALPTLRLAPFDASATLKLRLALQGVR